MRRREFIGGLGSVAAWPMVAGAQREDGFTVGWLSIISPANPVYFRQGLTDLGYVEGQNLTIEYRWAEGHVERLPALAADADGGHFPNLCDPGHIYIKNYRSSWPGAISAPSGDCL